MDKLIFILLIVSYIYMIVSTISVLLLENRNSVRSLAWIIVLVLIPVLGIIFYLIVGQNYRKQKIISRKSIKNLPGHQMTPFELKHSKITDINQSYIKLIHLLYNNNEAVGYRNNKIEIFSDGVSTFESMFNAIREAKEHIHIEFFIFEDDKISNQLRELLIHKAGEGVRVRMIYDYFGSFVLSKKYIKSLKDAGVYVRPFLPLRLRFRRSKINFRNHRKLLIVDGKLGFTGGLNVADRYFYGDYLGSWRDTFVRFEGSVVHGLQLQFSADWYFVEQKLINASKYFPEQPLFENNLVQIVSSGPDQDWEAIMQGIAQAIMLAKKYIYIHTPYFVPTEVILNNLQIAALSGIDVRLMLPKKSDSRLSDACSFSYLGQVLEAGVKVYLFQKGFLHSKAIVIDDYVSIIGSANLDERSFNQNFEANAFIYEEKTSKQLKQLFLDDVKNSNQITFADWTNRTRRQKLKESFARLFSPII